MSYPTPSVLQLPITPYEVSGYHFGERVRSRIILWARHLGDDVVVSAGTPVHAIGEGTVVWSEVRPGSAEKRNWGGIVVVGHKHKETETAFFSVYGHMRDVAVKRGDSVAAGQVVGVVAEGLTADNGWWKLPHLHFGIYVGPWMDTIVPGYKRFGEHRTRVAWWKNPKQFIEQYNQG